MKNKAGRLLCWVAFIGILTPPRSETATVQQKFSFDAISIKPNNTAAASSHTDIAGGYMSATNVSLKSLVLLSYELAEFQLVGAPDWLETERFDIQAPTDSIRGGKPDIKLFIQSLLEDRCGLKVHHETRDLPVFFLTVFKSGLKMQPTVEGKPGPDGLAPHSSSGGGPPDAMQMKGAGVTIDRLIKMLSSGVGRTIIDKTSLAGEFDFKMTYSRSPAFSSSVTTASSDLPSHPDIFNAVQEQLGLKLESGKGPVDVLVIDSVEKPTPNGSHR